SQRQADNQGLRVNVLTMIVYPALLFCRLKIPCVFLLPDPKNDRVATVPVALKALPETVWGEPQTPIAVTPTVYDHQPAE
ncbi:hypothetical protein LIP34_08035, partial [Bifidobacterium animalis]|uniref:hypothetical protein n=2 Tax=Bifidobacterium animalis TaxID=28025 RepID=UPI001D008DD8